MGKVAMFSRNVWTQWGVVASLLAVVALACLMPLEASANILVGVFFFAFGVCFLSFARDPRDRKHLVAIFAIAYGLRIIFMGFMHGFGLNEKLASGDEDGWGGAWWMSRFWRGYENAPPNIGNIPGLRPPNTFIELISGEFGHNKGWYHYAAYLFFLLDVRSQNLLAFINCFLNSMTACVVYRTAKMFCSEKASLFAAGAVVIFPGYLAWSTQTIKEPWVILLEILFFYFILLFLQQRKIWLLGLAAFTFLVVYSLRFYVAYIIVLATFFVFVTHNSPRPKVAAFRALIGMIVLYVIASGLGLITIDVAGIVAENMETASRFRQNVSGFGAKATSVNYGTRSGVYLDYDPTTPFGLVMLILVGSIYVLLSPFPWSLSGNQVFALPDVLIWWFLVFGFILVGIRSAWKNQPALAVSLFAFLTPLVVLYSLLFGNVGLAYRQRAQLMPFFLIFAAAGYDARRKNKAVSKSEKLKLLARLHSLASGTTTTATANSPNPTPVASASVPAPFSYAPSPPRRPETS